MYGNGGYTGDDRMCDLVSDRFAVLQVMSRFGIALGFGDKTIAEVCGEHRVDTATFLAVVNKLLGLGFGTQTAVQELSVRALTDYLHNAHGYFLEFRLPAIRRKLIEAIRAGKVEYDFVEVMACPGGCAGGGGQPIHDGTELAEDRGNVLWRLDQGELLRFSHENPDVKALYKDYLGAPLGEKSHHLLHTDHNAWQMPQKML